LKGYSLLDKALSTKLRVTMFIAIMMVVFNHAYNLKIKLATGTQYVKSDSATAFFENIISKGIARIAVPLFFIISGYLFFSSTETTKINFRKKILKRFKTLAVPFLFWSTLTFTIMYIAQLLPGTGHFLPYKLLRNCSLSQCLKEIFASTLVGHLWFIRDLFLYVLLTPIIYYVLRKTGIILLLGLVIVWFFEPFQEWPVFNIYGFIAFITGNFIAIYGIERKLTIAMSRWLIPIWVVIVFVRAYYLTYYGVEIAWLKNLGIMAGLAAVWFNYDLYGFFFEQKQIFWVTSFTFFVYAAHFAMIVIAHKIWLTTWGVSEASALVGYFVCPLFVILICVALAILFKRYCRGLYQVMTGWR